MKDYRAGVSDMRPTRSLILPVGKVQNTKKYMLTFAVLYNDCDQL